MKFAYSEGAEFLVILRYWPIRGKRRKQLAGAEKI